MLQARAQSSAPNVGVYVKGRMVSVDTVWFSAFRIHVIQR